uniref:Uncharacterized protein n=1 Tax=Arundo donax TaxID=35708 RepID=A0A0A9G5C4_ARUDO
MLLNKVKCSLRIVFLSNSPAFFTRYRDVHGITIYQTKYDPLFMRSPWTKRNCLCTHNCCLLPLYQLEQAEIKETRRCIA